MTSEESIIGLPTLGPVLVKARRGGHTVEALQFLDLRGGPTEPIRLRTIGIHVPDDPLRPFRRRLDHLAALDRNVELDPLTGSPLQETDVAWASGVEQETARTVEAVRRYARARAGINLRGSLLRRGWEPGLLIARRQLFPLDPPHLVWLDDEAWSADEVFCVTPTCPCQDLSIDFERLGEALLPGRLSATIDVGQWTITNTWGNGPAKQLAEAWMKQPGSRARARDLFQRAHEAGRFLLDPFAAKRGIVNPNSRCPCGRRKKFKRCCSHAVPSPVPGVLHTLKARAQDALIQFATEELGESLRLTKTNVDGSVPFPTEASQWAWLLYWRRYDGFTLADRFLEDADRGDLWLRRWIEAASGTPPDIFEVADPQDAMTPLASLTDTDARCHLALLPPGHSIEPNHLVLGAPVRLMGRTLLLGAWSGPRSSSHDLRSLQEPIDRLCHPDRVLQAMHKITTD